MLPKFPSGGGNKGGFSSTWSSYLPYVDTFKKRACRFILHHYLGRFLKDHLTLDQLTIDLYNGTGSLHNVPIDIYSVNDVLESQGIPIELVSGDIATITVSIPWSNIFQNASKVEIRSLNIAIKGQSASSDSTFLTESYFNSLMNTSMQVAQKCLKDGELASNFGSSPPSSLDSRSDGHPNPRSGNRQQQQGEAVEFFAQAIETVLLKVRISLINTKIRFESSDPYSDSIEIVVERIDFFDDSVSEEENLVNSLENEVEKEATPQFFTSNFSTKVFKLEGMSINHVPNACNVNKVMTEVLTTEEMNAAMGRGQNGDKQGVNPVKIGEFLGKLEAKVKMKQNPSVSGAKLSVDCMLGSLSLFTQPKHIKVLVDVLDGFINSSAPNALHEPPLEPSLSTGTTDKSGLMFATCQFENEINIHQNLPSLGAPGHKMNTGSAGLYQGHERVPVEMPSYYPNNSSVVYNDDDFYSIYDDASEHNSMTSSMISGSTTTATTQAFDQRKERATDKHHDPTMVNIRLNGLSLVLLESTTEDFNALSDNFYLKLHEVTNLRCGFGPKDAYDQKKLIESACDLNHITLLACPVNMRLILNQSKKGSKSNALLTFAFFEITECLNTPSEKQESTILTFANQKNFSPNDILAQPNMKIDITWSSSASKTDLSEPKKRVNFLLDLMPTILNVDLTLLDRLYEFFKPETRTKPEIFTASEAFVLDPEKDILEENSSETVSSFELRCPDLDLTFYIPIPIFEEEKSLLVSTQRLIRNEAFEFQFTSMSLKFDFTKIEEDLSVCLDANSIDMLLVSSVVSLRLCRISSDQRSKPFVSFKLYPFHCELESANHFDMNTASMYDSFPCDFSSNSRGKKSPFSSKVVIHNSQPVVNCGTHKEMREFADECLGDSRLVLKISLPHVSFFIPNKAVFDLVYNRFSNDLLLWEPLFSKMTPVESLTGSGTSKVGLGLASQAAAISRGKQHFSMCKSGIRSAYGNLSQGSDDGETTLDGENENESLYGESDSDREASQSWLSLQVKFGTVQLALSDVDKNNADVISFQSFSDLKNGTLFVVAGHAGCSDTTIITMSCFDGQYYHSEEEALCKPFCFDDQLNVKFPSYLDMKLRKSRLDMLSHHHQESFTNPLLSMAVRIHANKAKNFKHIKVAVNAEAVTLFHRFDQHQWYDDLLEMFSPRDEPIPGYKFLPVMTELHISLTNCAILYRPLHLPYTVVLNTGCCYMSSNVVADSPSSIFQLVIEAASLYLSCSRSLKSKLSDFAKIADTGLISLDVITQKGGHSSSSSKHKKKKSENQGTKSEIRLSCDIFNIYTCSDSLKVLSEVIQYLAASGDCPERNVPEDNESDVNRNTIENSQNLSGVVGAKGDSLVVAENKISSGDGGANGGVNLNQMIQSAINEDMVAN